MKPKTIDQYKIMKWLREQFFISELIIEFICSNKARITDGNGDTAIVICNDGKIELV